MLKPRDIGENPCLLRISAVVAIFFLQILSLGRCVAILYIIVISYFKRIGVIINKRYTK